MQPFETDVMHTTVASTPHLRTLGAIVIMAGLAVVFAATLVPQPVQADAPHFCLICGSLGGVNALLNILLFVPLGIGLALFGTTARRGVAMMCLLSIMIEAAQLWPVTGRDASIGDVITNTLGGWAGFALAVNHRALFRPSRRLAAMLVTGWGLLWMTIQVALNFAFAPSFPDAHYYGQIARSFGDLSRFSGTVLSARIDTISVPDVGYEKTAQLREALIDGAPVTALVVPVRPTDRLAPIIRVDSKGREIVLLAQRRRDLVFGVRTGAADLKLRPPLFLLADVFPPERTTGSSIGEDTVLVSGRYGSDFVELSAASVRDSRARSIPVSATMGWTLVTPERWYITGNRAEMVLSWLWTSALLFPIGYWSVFTRSSESDSGSRWWIGAAASALVLITFGLLIAPPTFGLEAPGISAWMAAFTGLSIAAVLGERVKRLTHYGRD